MCVYTLPLHLDQEGLGDATDCAVSLLHMEDVPGRAQRCFAAVGCGIRVYQLCSGRLLSSQSSLHHCPLSAMLFFRPLRLLATADCDGASEAVSLPPSHTHLHTRSPSPLSQGVGLWLEAVLYIHWPPWSSHLALPLPPRAPGH